MLLETTSEQQPCNSDAVAGYHDNRRDQKAKNMNEPLNREPPCCRDADVKAIKVNEKSRHSKGTTENPHHCAKDPAAILLVTLECLPGVHNHKVTIDANTGEEDDADVEVCVHDDVEEFPKEVS